MQPSRAPGVLEASANLDDAVKVFAQAPESFDAAPARLELVGLYAAAGYGAGATVLEKCTRIMRDPGEALPAKILAVRVLDLLMAEQDAQLARVFVSQLKFFTGIAKRSKERERKKRRPTGMFPSHAGDDEVAQFVAAVGELLDKWGRYFEEAPAGSELQAIARARVELLQDQVRLPPPESYRHLIGGVPPGGSAAPPGGALDEAHLGKLAEEFRTTLARLGAEATETAEAHSRFEAELDRWRRAAQEAAEKDDFAGVEQYSGVAFRFSELGSRLESCASASVSAATSGASTPVAPPPAPLAMAPVPALGTREGQEESSSSGSRSKKRHHRSSKDLGGTGREGGGFPAGLEADGFPGGSTADGFSGWPQQQLQQQQQQPEPTFTSKGSPYFSDFAGGGAQGDVTDPVGGLADDSGLGFFPARSPDFASLAMGLSGPSGFGTAGGSGLSRRRGGSAEERPPAASPEGGKSEHEAALLATNTQLQVQVQALQAQNQTLQAQLDLRFSEGSGAAAPPERLRAALRRVRELEPLQAELSDARATSASLRELNSQLQSELDQCRREMRVARQRAAQAEERLAEREELISETRQRLFDAKQRSAQLEDEMRNQSEVQKSLQGRLQSARADRVTTELELRQLRHVITSVGGVPPQSDQPRGNQSYSRDGAGTRPAGASLPSVNKFDELAGSALGGSSGPRGEGQAGTPLQQLARCQSLGDAAHAPAGQERAPTIPRSPPEAWCRTPRIARPPGALVSQTPPAHRGCLERTNANFQALLARPRGPLYEDQCLLMELSVAPASAAVGSGRFCLDFEVCIANRTGHTLHDVQLRPSEPSAQCHACELRLAPEPPRGSGSGGGVLLQQQQRWFRGRLEAYGPFETAPQVDFSYLLPDNLTLKARLRLPLAITRAMTAAKLEAAHVAELWAEPELAHSEVAVVCTVRGTLLGAGAPFSVWKCMELGGVFRCFPGIDENPRGAVFASTYPQRQGAMLEVLVRAELGGPGRTEDPGGAAAPSGEAACRLAVRSASHQVNRALAQVLLDALCDAPESATAA